MRAVDLLTIRSVAVALALAAASCAQYTQVNNYCPTVESTGGDPTGDWLVTASCQVPYGRTSAADWCSNLNYNEIDVRDGLFLGSEFIPISATKPSTVKYIRDPSCGQLCGTYEAQLVFESPPDMPTTTHFTRACLSQHLGASDGNCIDLQAKIMALAENVLPTITELKCDDEPDGSGGCACSYIVSTATLAADVGFWRVRDNLLIHYPSAPQTTVAGMADMAIGTDGTNTVMFMRGHEGVPLLAHDPLKYLELRKISSAP
jgi:hypothetical protein